MADGDAASARITAEEALALHASGRPGKLETRISKKLTTARDLSLAYFPRRRRTLPAHRPRSRHRLRLHCKAREELVGRAAPPQDPRLFVGWTRVVLSAHAARPFLIAFSLSASLACVPSAQDEDHAQQYHRWRDMFDHPGPSILPCFSASQ